MVRMNGLDWTRVKQGKNWKGARNNGEWSQTAQNYCKRGDSGIHTIFQSLAPPPSKLMVDFSLYAKVKVQAKRFIIISIKIKTSYYFTPFTHLKKKKPPVQPHSIPSQHRNVLGSVLDLMSSIGLGPD